MSEKPHKKLIAWQKAMELIEAVYALTRRLPREEQFGLVAQMRRAAVSVASNIAEGAARQTIKEQVQGFYIARGSISELDTQMEIVHRLGMISTEQRTQVIEELNEVGRLVNGLIVSKKRGATQSYSLTHNSLTH